MADEDKIFNQWNKVKKKLNKLTKGKYFKEGEIWWCGVGKNVGVEVYGKGESFSRPVLIYKKLSGKNFLGICLTSRTHTGSWYVRYELGGKVGYVNLSQVKTLSVNRLYKKIGKMSDRDIKKVIKTFRKLYCGRKNFLRRLGLR
ncbi:type II toxin-antitoxin system PemK/MazF family toxin [Candidatus Saccharibacteria bacterium]|nr:type II toxin-antitoxin system PemK/MazF family toxin [Candidatus Saccharibacteria bacterium]